MQSTEIDSTVVATQSSITALPILDTTTGETACKKQGIHVMDTTYLITFYYLSIRHLFS